MQEDDVMPNDGTFMGGVPLEPREQVIERKKERAQTLEAAKISQAILEHFKERIAYRDTLNAIRPDLTKSPEMHQKVCEVNAMLKLALEEERSLLEELLSMYVT